MSDCACCPSDEMAGWHILTDWEDARPGDILYDGELWMACRDCNWNGGHPLHQPEGAIVIQGCGLSAIPWDRVGKNGNEYRGYCLMVEPWQEMFFKGYACWILGGPITITKVLGATAGEAAEKAGAKIDSWLVEEQPDVA